MVQQTTVFEFAAVIFTSILYWKKTCICQNLWKSS